jgi:hypothetical protein
MIRVALLMVAVAAFGCSKPSEEDCRKAIANMQRLMGTENLRDAATIEGDVRRCKGGSHRKAVKCAMEAKTLDDLRHCDFYKVPENALGIGSGSAAGSATGSAAGSATGSAAGSATGSGAGSATGSAAGSATGSAAGSATGSAAGSATGSAAGSAMAPATGAATGSATAPATGSATGSAAGSAAPTGSAAQ